MAEFDLKSAEAIARATKWVSLNRRVSSHITHRARWIGLDPNWEVGVVYETISYESPGLVTIWRWNGIDFEETDIKVNAHGWTLSTGESFLSGTRVLVWEQSAGIWVVAGGSAVGGFRLVELCLAENHPGRGLPFDAYLGVWDDVTNGWRYETGTGSVCEGDGIVKAIDWRHGVPYPEAGAKGLFTPRDSYEFGTIYECVSLDCTSPGACCTYETGP